MYRLLACVLAVVAISSGRPRTAARPGARQFRPLPLDQQKLTGLLGSRLRANTEGFLENLKTESLTGELGGLFLDAASDAYEYNGDVQLRSQMDQVAAVLYAEPTTDSEPSSAAQLRTLRTKIVGILGYYRVTADPKALNAALKLGKLLLSPPAAAPEKPVLETTQVSMAHCLVLLYRFSQDSTYLEAARKRAEAFRPPDLTGRLDNETLTEALLGFRTLVSLYEYTDASEYLRSAISGWEQVQNHRISITGAPLVAANDSMDGCAAVAWEQLTYSLLRVTGLSRYGDQLEDGVYNQSLAVQDARTGALAAVLPLNGAKTFLTNVADAKSAECLLSEAKALASLPRLAWGQFENGIAINLYNPGRAFFRLGKRGLVRIYLESNFPQSGELQLHIEPGGKGPAHFSLRLRVPAWSTRFEVQARDLHLSGRPGDYVVVERDWHAGDTVTISLDLPTRIVSPTVTPNVHYVLRGPQVLALTNALNTNLREGQTATVLPETNGDLKLTSAEDATLPHSWVGDQVYRVPGRVGGKKQNLLLVPLADALNYRTNLVAQPD